MTSAESAVAVAIAQRRSLLHSDAIQRVLAFGALIVLFAIFSVASPNFLQFDNIVGILLATSVNGVLALGVTFVIITGGIDLSVGTVMTLSAVMTAVFISVWHLSAMWATSAASSSRSSPPCKGRTQDMTSPASPL